MTNAPGEWPALDEYIAGPDILGFAFAYPAQYLDCIAWGDQDIDAGGDGHALTFLDQESIKTDLQFFVRKATFFKRLVPFARGDNGDALFCFGGSRDPAIYVINLGDKRLQARPTGFSDFVAFINDYRRNMDLPPWAPEP